MRWAVAMIVSGCAYHAPEGSIDPIDVPAIDAATVDAAIDTPSTASCALGTTGAATDRGKVGLSIGGGFIQPLACDGDTRIVGVAIDLSNGNADNATRSAIGIEIGCATVTIDGTGTHVGTVVGKEKAGNGGNNWSPSTLPDMTMCPAGAVMSGLAIHGSSFTTYFLDADLACTRFDATGAVVATTQIHVAGSGTDNNHPSAAACDAGEQVTELTANTGAGLDSVRLQCRQTACE